VIAVPAAAERCLGPLSQIPKGEGRLFQLRGGEPPGDPDRVADSTDRPGRAGSADLEALAVFHLRSGVVHATQADCPHRNGPLADGLIGGTTLICPLHGQKFDLTTGAALSGGRGLATFPVRVTEAGEIMVGVEPAPADGDDSAAPGQRQRFADPGGD
jgi:nitrite reductase (NADH) small subunit